MKIDSFVYNELAQNLTCTIFGLSILWLAKRSSKLSCTEVSEKIAEKSGSIHTLCVQYCMYVQMHEQSKCVCVCVCT